jgi:hypothetical protein
MLEFFDCEQCSPEWYALRAGIPTASEFHTVLARGKTKGEVSKTRLTYLRKLAGEIITGEPMEAFTNAHLERGKAMEDEARDFYAFMHDAELERVGFIKNGQTGCSPDSLLAIDGMVEIKTALPHILIEKLEADKFPPEHAAQCQGGLWVTGRDYIDLIIYWPKMPLFVKRAFRDEEYISTLAGEVDRFNEELAALVERVRRYGSPSTIKADLAASVAA